MAAMPQPAMPRCTPWARCCAMAATEQKASYLPRIADGALRLQAFGVTEPTSGTDTAGPADDGETRRRLYVVNGQKIWTSPGGAFRSHAVAGANDPSRSGGRRTDGLSVFLIDLRELVGKGITIRPIRTMINHSTTEVFFDNVQMPARH